MRTTNSSIGRMVKFLMLEVPRMKKVKLLESLEITVESIKDGELSILIKLDQSNPRDSTRIGASMSIDHSI
jgi:hypothetical protein